MKKQEFTCYLCSKSQEVDLANNSYPFCKGCKETLKMNVAKAALAKTTNSLHVVIIEQVNVIGAGHAL